MFCPQCGAENEKDKSYCRRCGQSLAAVRLALEGRVDEAIKTVEGDKKLSGYRLRVALAGVVIVAAILTILTGVQIGFRNIQSAALILILLMILFWRLSWKYHRVARLLDAEDQSVKVKLTTSPQPALLTEQNTLELKRKE